jgi:predicted TIM-barrel fold metal-dependent hydrolase
VVLWAALACACSGGDSPRIRRDTQHAGESPTIPKVDVHMHIAMSEAEQALQIMAQAGIQVGLNASGGVPGPSLDRSVALDRRSGGRLRALCNVDLAFAASPGAAETTRALVRACKEAGGLGLKIPKTLGLGLVGSDRRLLPVDTPQLDPLFDEAGAQGLPVLIHSAGPTNERHAELLAHPGWSFHGETPYGEPWPSWTAILEAFERRVARHPGTKFLGAHFGNAPEDPARVGRMLDRLPNYYIDTAARVPEIGRHPSDSMRAFFVKYQDRILFGSDLAVLPGGLVLGSGGRELDPPGEAPRFFRAHWQYFETRLIRFAHPTPIQGSWTIDGIGLPRQILEKVYWRNAARLFSLSVPEQTASGGN